MPVISRFHGIVVFMNYNDHPPPHLHARHEGAEALVLLGSRRVRGELPPRPLRMLLHWVDLHYDELLVNWRRAREHEYLLPIEPLP